MAVRESVSKTELVASGPDQKNWRGIGIALLVIVVVCALIVAAIVLLTPGDAGVAIRKSRITLEEVVKGRFSYRRFNGTWISDHEFVYQDAFGAIGIYNVANNSEQIIMSNTTFRQHSISQFFLSADRQYILMSHKYERIFRYTYKAAFLLYNVSSEYLAPLFPDNPDVRLQYAEWGPTGNQLVYVLDNNVYYLSDISAKPRQLTKTGVDGLIFNGIPDWVYEEEVITSNNVIWWSEDGKKLCFVSFNDTDVDLLQYPYYGSYADVNNVYPELVNLRYPKAGKTNPTFTIWVTDLIKSKENIPVQVPKEYKDLEYYFTEIQWVGNDALSVVWLKRAQNTSIISICRQNDGWICKKNLQEDAHGHGWVDVSTSTVFSSDKKYYFIKLPGPSEGDAGRFRHVAAVDVKDGTKTFLTSGKYDTVSILDHNIEKNTVYYITTLEGKPGERHLFGVTDLKHKKPKNTTCLTCDLGPDCLYNDATFSKKLSYYVLECLGPGIPRVEIRATDSNKIISTLLTNDDLKDFIETKAMPKIKNLQVPIDGNYHANVRLFLPPYLQEYEITKYPMLVEVYGGPGSQMISEKFSVNWGSYLASKKNVIYAWIDGRGSGYRGDKILHEVYRKLGTVEIFDQLSVTSYLKDHLQYVDGKHVAIFGWSYGGYASALAVASEEKVFSCGISVAPVTSWLYYDSLYTERYMQSPAPNDNLINYENSDVMRKASSFKGKKYLLVHGSADDNVHWQQSMMLAKALTDAGVIFRMQVYPDENHALGHVKLHLYQTMDDFLDHCYSDASKDDSTHMSTSADSDR
ncbi:prolyl endopeptidase FAP-like isoform X2 [Uloborus diversus]|uniref:prolyl endopeptidase FAP-like isoform X2 n=1 Tax=Uloborus diversus TaxID=327109 RepID=UPI002409AFE2|nr:prolyl endopeptidase FAP-like isoform X2 [Uloborus diversus]